MNLAAWYLQIKFTHITLAAVSGSLFALRGVGVLAGAGWPMRALARRASMGIDTALLAAGATLWSVAALNPLRDHWLAGKLLLLPVYVVLGSMALKRARTSRGKLLCFVLALATFAAIGTLALTHRA
jgi:uncharacterized membrane protein SirB2